MLLRSLGEVGYNPLYMTNDDIINQLHQKTMVELSRADRESSTSRDWSSPKGYRFLVQWSNAVLLRILIRKFTVTLPLRSSDISSNSSKIPYKPLSSSNNHYEDRLKTQLDDAGRSVISNIEEGYKRATTVEYLKFIGFSQGSLEEIHGLVNQCHQDGFLKSKPGSNLTDPGIDLKTWNLWCRNPANSSRLKEFKGKYGSLEEIKGNDLTYEIFIELINKTDFLLRKLVTSLESKIQQDKSDRFR